MAAFAVMFQIIPVLFTEVFAFVTSLSALPVYFMSRVHPRTGVMVFFVSAALVMTISIHEGLFFLVVNGPVGLSLGIFHRFTKTKTTAALAASGILTVSLSIVNYALNVPVFSPGLRTSTGLGILILFLFSVVYCSLYINVADLFFRKVNRLADFDKIR